MDGAGSRRKSVKIAGGKDDMKKKLFLHTDGCSRGNPGPSGIGVLIQDHKKKVLKESYRYLGEATNNIAEYSALIHGLEEASMIGADEVTVYMDSELVVRQINGEYRVKDAVMKRLFADAIRLLGEFKSFEVKHIDRSKNKEADKLANKAINLAGV